MHIYNKICTKTIGTFVRFCQYTHLIYYLFHLIIIKREEEICISQTQCHFSKQTHDRQKEKNKKGGKQ